MSKEKPPRSSARKRKAVESSAFANVRPRAPKPPSNKTRRHGGKVHPAMIQPGLEPGVKRDDDGRKGSHAVRSDRIAEKTYETIVARAEEAAQYGMLPHEFLLAVMRGQQLSHFAYDSEGEQVVEIVVLPTFQDRIDCAKAAAPYYSPRMASAGSSAPPPPSNDKRPGVMEVPLVDSMQQWASIAGPSQARLKQEVTK